MLRGARTRMARKPPALARELARNFPKRRGGRGKRRRRRGGAGANGDGPVVETRTGHTQNGTRPRAEPPVREGGAPATVD